MHSTRETMRGAAVSSGEGRICKDRNIENHATTARGYSGDSASEIYLCI